MKEFFKRGRKNSDPVKLRSRELNSEIASLEDRIKQLHSQLEHAPAPKLRSTAMPHGGSVPASESPLPQKELVFEPVDHDRIHNGAPPKVAQEHLGQLGKPQKFNAVELWEKIRVFFQGRTASNPKLFKYLAAGNIQGLRPLRYEKRVARNRTLLWTAFLLLVLWGLFAAIK